MARILIIGSGVVGTATGKGLIRHGHVVEFRDTNESRIASLSKEGFTSNLLHEPLSSPVDFLFICVPTPNHTISNLSDLSALKIALEFAGKAIKEQGDYSCVVIRSTVPVGTNQDLAVPLLEATSSKRAGVGFGVCSNPEYLREHAAVDDFEHPRLVIIGSEDPKASDALHELYKPFNAKICVLSSKEAEMHKYTHNLLNACKISFFNEQRQVCDTLGIDADTIFPLVTESAEAAWNPLYGTRNLGPYEGMCLPKDTQGFLAWATDCMKINLPLLAAIISVNKHAKRVPDQSPNSNRTKGV